MTVSETIDRFGGSSATARICGIVPSAVSNWRANGAIPPRHYLALAEAARWHQIDLDPGLFREVSKVEAAQ
jgi:hypothetical protein